MASLWRRVPAPLWLACGVAIACNLLSLVRAFDATEHELMYGSSFADTLWIASSGMSLVIVVLLLITTLWLARRTSGAAAVGAKLAAAGLSLRLASVLAWFGYCAHISLNPMYRTVTVQHVLQVAMLVEAVMIAVGLGIAARRWWAIVLGAAVGLTSPIWLLGELYSSLIAGVRGQLVIMDVLSLAWLCTVLALALLAFRGAGEDGGDDSGVPGLRRIAFALRGRVVAALILGCVGLLFVGPADDRGLTELYDLVELAAVAIEAALLVVLALGALRAVRGRGALPSWPMAISAGAALWVTGVSLQTLGSLYVRLVRPASYDAPQLDVFVHVSATVTGLVAACAVAGVLISLTIAARRRDLDDLRQRLVSRTGWFVGLALAAIAIEHWLGAPFAQTLVAALIRIAAAVLAIAALWIAASACGDAARALSSEPGLPAARIVRS